MKLLITGATGFAGGEVLRQALEDSTIAEVLVLTRKRTGVTHAKVREVLVADFTDYSAVDLAGVDACVWALGVSETAVDEAQYVKITYDFPVAAAEALFRASPDARFCFVSGRNADPSEQSRRLFTRIKGRAEKRLSELSANVCHFRPGYIRPNAATGPRKDWTRFFAPIGSAMSFFLSDFDVAGDDLGRALLRVAKGASAEHTLENGAIRALGRA